MSASAYLGSLSRNTILRCSHFQTGGDNLHLLSYSTPFAWGHNPKLIGFCKESVVVLDAWTGGVITRQIGCAVHNA